MPLTIPDTLPAIELLKKENIFVICKTPMAKAITQRTLCGFEKTTINAHVIGNQ